MGRRKAVLGVPGERGHPDPPREQRAGSAGTAGATGRAGPGTAGWLAAGDTVTCDAAPWGQRRVGLGRCLRGGAAEAAGQA